MHWARHQKVNKEIIGFGKGTPMITVSNQASLRKYPVADFRKESLADFREDLDFDNLSQDENVPKKPERPRAAGNSIF